MHEHATPIANKQEEHLTRGKFLLQVELMKRMLPQFGLSEIDWSTRGYAAAFHAAYADAGQGWWSRFVNGETEPVLQEMQERVMEELRASRH